jgi:hypothetical protein
MPRDKLIQPRRGTAAEWTAANPVLADSEFGFETDTKKMKMGDGSTDWASLTYISTWGGGGGGSGTVTSVSVTTANGVSGSVATPTTTPAITLTLGAITPSSVNASGTITASNFSGTSSGTNTGDQNLAPYATLASPTFTGTVTLPAGQAVNGVTLTTGGSASDFLNAAGNYVAAGGGSPAFSAITGATNTTAAMVVGTGASLSASGSGTITATTTTGNAGTATTLQTARNINGVSFNGSADITVTAAAGTLTGATLAASVTASSLTSVGTLTSGTWNATAIGDTYITSAATWNAKQAALVSGTNIKTINGSTILGAGDLVVSASPAGSNTQIQFNDSSVLGADADFTWDKTTNTLALGGTDTGVTLNNITTEPSSPAAGLLRLYSATISGRVVPKVKDASGLDVPLQNAFWGGNITQWIPTGATAGLWIGTVGAGAGTFSNPVFATTSLYTTMKRSRWANVITTANQVLGQRNTETMYFRGSVAGQGGFFFFARMGLDVWTNGCRMFVGMATATTVISANPSALNNTVGFCIDSGDAGLISFLTRDGATATKQSTGLTAVSGKGYDCYIFCSPNGSDFKYRIVDINVGTVYSNTATLTLPVDTTGLTANVLASNAAVTPATSVQIGCNKIYVETDY